MNTLGKGPVPMTTSTFVTAVEQLRIGELVILPTDTVYGICADVENDAAVQALYEAKGKSFDTPLQLIFDSHLSFKRYARLEQRFSDLIRNIGSGGWTLVLPASSGWNSLALAGGNTIGVRSPEVPLLRELIRILGRPIVASSANRHGEPSPTTCNEAIKSLGVDCAIALDGGPTVGLDSTVIDCVSDPVRILREGAIPAKQISNLLDLKEIEILHSVRNGSS